MYRCVVVGLAWPASSWIAFVVAPRIAEARAERVPQNPPMAASHGVGPDAAVTTEIYTTQMTPGERRFDEVLLALRDMFMRAQGSSPIMLEDLIDPTVRREPRTLNYLVASASGTLQDRYFTPANGDKITGNEKDEFNARYRALLDEAVELAWRLSLPAARDRFRR